MPDDSKLGVDLRRALALEDTILTLNLTPNRGDTMSVRGLAREVAALQGKVLVEKRQKASAARDQARFPVKLSSPQACPRFVGRVIRGVNARAQSPLWLRERLRRSGLRPINPIVDVTRFVIPPR